MFLFDKTEHLEILTESVLITHIVGNQVKLYFFSKIIICYIKKTFELGISRKDMYRPC